MSAHGKQQVQQLGRKFLSGSGHCRWETLELGAGSALGHGAHTSLGAGPLAVGRGAWFSQNTRDAAGMAGLRNSRQLHQGSFPHPGTMAVACLMPLLVLLWDSCACSYPSTCKTGTQCRLWNTDM